MTPANSQATCELQHKFLNLKNGRSECTKQQEFPRASQTVNPAAGHVEIRQT